MEGGSIFYEITHAAIERGEVQHSQLFGTPTFANIL